jgi:hypothetical protein
MDSACRIGFDSLYGDNTIFKKIIDRSKGMSYEKEKLALLQLESAITLTSLDFVEKWLHEKKQHPDVKMGRGRRPGAAPEEERCTWILVDKSQCKNARHESHSYCRIHLGKIHLVDPGKSTVSLS